MKIYVASSWRNPWQVAIVKLLREDGHDVYDFREPEPGVRGFAWSEIDPEWKVWGAAAFRDALTHPAAEHGYARDIGALIDADVCVLVLPCGRSAHMELGIAIGAGKQTAILYPHGLPVGTEGIELFGHPNHANAGPCSPCGDLDGCWLPSKLKQIEPELMAKAADFIAIDVHELRAWLTAIATAHNAAAVSA